MRVRWRVRLLAALAALIPAGCDWGSGPDDAGPVVTLLVVYTPGAAGSDLPGEIRQAVDETNRTFRDSRMRLRLRLVHTAEVAYATTDDRLLDLRRLVRPGDGHLDEVHALRDRYEADLCVLANPRHTINAAVLAVPETGFALVRHDVLGAPDYGMAHELGHLFGARHHPESDPSAEPFPDGHGRLTDRWRTIMANGPVPRIPYWSNPAVSYEGMPTGTPGLHNAARALDEAAAYVSNFRGPQTPTAFVPPGTWPVVEP